MLIKWEDISSVNVKEFDGHHKKLVSIINLLAEAKKADNHEEITRLLDELSEYANYHLAAEERYFLKFGYPEQKAHESFHKSYRDTIIKLKEEYNKNPSPETLSEIIKFLGNWWINHINREDTKYSNFLNKNGLY
jgi:hemerythrin-like metal-binding protein